jgi:hypothetical protein
MRCFACQSEEIPPGHRRYCAACSPKATARWKAAHRRLWAEQWRAEGRSSPPPWLDGWPSLEARRAYYRAYMRAWRQRRRAL